jgi:hypothetical protein
MFIEADWHSIALLQPAGNTPAGVLVAQEQSARGLYERGCVLVRFEHPAWDSLLGAYVLRGHGWTENAEMYDVH